MDITKLEGIVSAIEVESTQPSPSHNNLARLSALFFKELIAQLMSDKACVKSQETVAVNTVGVTFESPAPEQKLLKPRKSKKS